MGTRSSFVLLAYPGDVLLTIPFMMNNSGTTVGFYIGGDGSQHAFQYRGGQFANLDVPGATFSAATGVNDRGPILGMYGDEAFAFHHEHLAERSGAVLVRSIGIS